MTIDNPLQYVLRKRTQPKAPHKPSTEQEKEEYAELLRELPQLYTSATQTRDWVFELYGMIANQKEARRNTPSQAIKDHLTLDIIQLKKHRDIGEKKLGKTLKAMDRAAEGLELYMHDYSSINSAPRPEYARTIRGSLHQVCTTRRSSM
ncbi:hypothetical protein FIBSPDRAFT_878537, partial [Athelia psychrophila]